MTPIGPVSLIPVEHSASSRLGASSTSRAGGGGMRWGLPDPQEGVCRFRAADVTSAHLGRQLRSLHTGSALGEQDGGLIGAEEKVINSKKKVDENMVSLFSLLRVRVNSENDQMLPCGPPRVRAHREAQGGLPLPPQLCSVLQHLSMRRSNSFSSSSSLALQWKIIFATKGMNKCERLFLKRPTAIQ